MQYLVNSVAIEGDVVVVGDVPIGDESLPCKVDVRTPAGVDDDALAAAAAVVVTDEAGLERVRDAAPGTPTVACVDRPDGPVATDPAADGLATDPAGIDAQVRRLLARADDRPVRDEPARSTDRIERLHTSAARLAAVRSVEEAYRAMATIAEDVFPEAHCAVGVADGEWVEPVAASGDPPAGEPSIEGNVDHDTYRSALTVPAEANVVLQLLSTERDAFDEGDLELAELLASHLEETHSRLRADAALRTERDRLLALFENIPDAAVEHEFVDGNPRIRRVNRAFEETFGYDADEVVGESIDDYVIPDDEGSLADARELNARLQRGENVRREVTRRTADGERHFILHVVPVALDVKNASGFAIYTDVTERREREATLRRQNEQLDAFTSIVSHDLRNPLSVAEGYLDLARQTGETEHLAPAAEALSRMDELIGDLLTLARDGHVVGETQPVSLAALAKEAWGCVDTPGAELRVADDWRCEADPNRVRELFENLFRNAVEHGSTSNRTESDADDDADETHAPNDAPADAALVVRVGVVDDPADGPVGFYVEDDGAGFPDDDGDRLFESGYTTDGGGTGLGLAISEHIATAHGWDVRATTGRDGGARIEFRTE